jgi:transposase
MLDLYRATRDDLIALVVAQQEALVDQARRIAVLEAELATLRRSMADVLTQLGRDPGTALGDDPAGGGTARGVPGLKPVQAAAQAPRRRRRAQGAGRRRMRATARQVHALRRCPGCDAPLAGGTIKRTREVIEIPIGRVAVTEHVYLERRCPDCGRRCVPAPDLGGVVCGQRRFGHGLLSLIAVLREEARLPFATIRSLLRTLYGLEVSVGALVEAVRQVATCAEPVLAELQAAIRASPVVHVDETGWREAGRNGYVWTFSTPQTQLFLRGSRAREMLTRGLGADFAGVVVSDFYGVYTSDAGTHQFCWAHLLRDVHDLTTRYPQDTALQGWAIAVHAIFTRAQAAATGDDERRRRERRQAECDLRAICRPWLDLRVAQTGLCQRILTQLASLFVFVTDPAVPATNNAAERSLRHLVVARKISGGTRSAQGSHTKMTLASLFGTWRARGCNPFDACRLLLASPQL